MKKYLSIFFAFVCFGSFCQERIEISGSDFRINSVGESPSIIIELLITLPEGQQIDDEDFDGPDGLNKELKLALRNSSDEKMEGVSVDAGVVIGNKIRIAITGLSLDQIDELSSSGNEYFVDASQAILFSSHPEGKKYKISVADVKTHSLMKMQIGEETAKELVTAMGGEVNGIENSVDFGIQPAENSETGKSEYFLKFSYRDIFTSKNSRLYYAAKGLLSTNSDDSLNFLSLYPINYKLAGHKNELVGQLGVEGNQRFTNYRVSGTFSWQGLTPNFINLTMGENRLRLKPIVKVGIKFYQEIENNRPVELDDNQFSNQVFAELFYYIPIQKLYSLTFQGQAFYDFNDKVNPDKELMYNYSIMLGIEIPKTPIKTIFKYTAGANGINYEYDSILLLGFAADLFSLKD